jgi:imidazolonepropionase-like amidohydrolase
MWRLSPAGPLAEKLVSVDDESGQTLFRGGHVVDATGRDRFRADVLVSGQRIVSVGAIEADVAADRIVDCSGATILPGLIDAHVHFGGEITSDPYRRYLWPDDRLRTIRAALTAYATLEAGFTTVRDVGLTGAGYALRYAINDGWILGPRILTAGPSMSSTGGHGDWHALPLEMVRERRFRSIIADGVTECRRAVREVHREGADLLKIFVSNGILTTRLDWPPVPSYTVDEIQAMVDEAHSRGMRVASHALGVESIRRAILGGTDTIEHGGILEGEDPAEVLDLMAERGVILVPTLAVFYNTIASGRQWGNIEEGIQRAEGMLRRAQALIAGGRDRGVRIALGTDTSSRAGVGENAREMQLLCEAGLSPMGAVRSGTRVAAEALGLEQHLGTIEPGKLADLLVVESNPLDDLTSLIGCANVRFIARAAEPLSTRWQP